MGCCAVPTVAAASTAVTMTRARTKRRDVMNASSLRYASAESAGHHTANRAARLDASAHVFTWVAATGRGAAARPGAWGPFEAPMSNDRVADAGGDPLAHQHRAEHEDEDHRDLWPREHVDGGLQVQADAARTDEAEYRRLADIHVPAEYRDAREGRHHLRHDSVRDDLPARGAGGRDRFHRSRVDLLDRLVEQLGDETDG